MTRTLLLAATVAALAGPAAAQAPPADAGVTVPFTLLPSRHMLMKVTLNGRGPYNLIFDTGAPINLVNARVAKEAKLAKAKGGIGGGFGFGLFGGISQVEVGSLKLGEVTAEKLPAVVMDHPTVRAISDMFAGEYGPIEGIVGFPFFGRFATTIDYQAKEMRLKPTAFKPGDYLTDLTQGLLTAGDRGGESRVVGAAGLWGFAVEPAGDGQPGVIVSEVFADGPAAVGKLGKLKVGDRLLTLDGRWTDSVADTYLAASLVKPGRTVVLVARRGSLDRVLAVTPAKGY